ncbi:MAG TPA: metal-sensing transcriptional repressor [Candidatus Bathyarchaeia archaeon]|nr:metal-sensing transcriptional repressor [Candidatus Bathyarchaeia archaeon]
MENKKTESKKQASLLNFKKARSHIGKIIKMIEKDAYCVDIMQQNLAVIGLLRSAHQKLMENHLNTCFIKALDSRNTQKKEKMVQEILKVASLFNR